MKTISVRLSDEEKEAFDNRCKELDLTMSQIMRKLIRDFINTEKEDAGPDKAND
jgi:antitoxin component of RelBE/YafQ-DinJ toxin-antitoxin module